MHWPLLPARPHSCPSQPAAEITLDTAFVGVGDLPLHPGAERYYKEIGLK
ncbi:MAG: TAXI family TRAP transporter solute-binding subunit [bacterium]|nr:TAXI family TRAP transporter solute-binding subunit [bacterium]